MIRFRVLLKIFSFVLACVYLATNCVFSYAAETNFWVERKRVASVPPTGLSTVILPVPSAQLLFSVGKLPQINSYGSVRRIVGPSTSRKTVIHIQDVHRNPEAQANIARALQTLIGQNQVGLVALEGAFDPIDFSSVKKFPYPDSVKAVADYLLKTQKISGAVYAMLTLRLRSGQAIPAVVGVDQREHYFANVEAYRQSAPLVAAAKESLRRRQGELDRKKVNALNPELRAFDATVSQYRAGSLSVKEYVRSLSSHTDVPPSVQFFLRALTLESQLDFAGVEKERGRLLAALAEKLDSAETKDLIARSSSYRLGNMQHAEFYSYLENLCRRKNISLAAQYPSMDAYIRYVSLADALNAEDLIHDLRTAEDKRYALLAKTSDEKKIVAESEYFYLVGKLVDFSLTKEEWTEYKTVYSPWPIDHRPNLSSFERFYSEAEARDQAMSANLLKAMDANKTSVAVLITGGFHSTGIDRKLNEAGFSTISFVPKITHVDTASGSAYLSVFTQQKTPLDRLFQGEKLFLSELQLVHLSPIEPAAYGHRLLTHPGEVATAPVDLIRTDVEPDAGVAKVTTGLGTFVVHAHDNLVTDLSFKSSAVTPKKSVASQWTLLNYPSYRHWLASPTETGLLGFVPATIILYSFWLWIETSHVGTVWIVMSLISTVALAYGPWGSKEKFLGLHNLLSTDPEWTKKSQAIDELRRVAWKSLGVSVVLALFFGPTVAYGIFATLVLLAHYVNDWEAQKKIRGVEPRWWVQKISTGLAFAFDELMGVKLGIAELAAGGDQGMSSRQVSEEFNPGHGARLWQRVKKEREKLLKALQRSNQHLTIRFVNLLHSGPVQPSDIPEFSRSHAVTFELPSSAVKAVQEGRPTKIRENTFWMPLLEEAKRLTESAEENMAGVYGIDVSDVRNDMRRITYAYTSVDFGEDETRRKIMLRTNNDPKEELTGLGQGTPLLEDAILPRLSLEQKIEYEKKHILWLHPGDADPCAETGPPLKEAMILYRCPNQSIRMLMRQLESSYKVRLVEQGISKKQVRTFLVDHYFYSIFILARDQMQLFTMFRRLQMFLSSSDAPAESKLLSLHLGGALHFQDLISLASRDLAADAPLSLESQDDPRLPLMPREFKGSPFFAERFEKIFDHLRVQDNELEFDIPYFRNLFSEFLNEESRMIMERRALRILLPEAPEISEEAPIKSADWEATRAHIALTGAISILGDNDLNIFLDQKKSNNPSDVFRNLTELLAKSDYAHVNGLFEERQDLKRSEAVALCNLGMDLIDQKKYSEAISISQRAIELNPRDAANWVNLGIVYRHQGKLSEARSALMQATEINPRDSFAWLSLGMMVLDQSKISQVELRQAIFAIRQSIESDPQNAVAWSSLGFFYEMLNEIPQAISAYEQVLRIEPENFTAAAFIKRHRAKKYDSLGSSVEPSAELSIFPYKSYRHWLASPTETGLLGFVPATIILYSLWLWIETSHVGTGWIVMSLISTVALVYGPWGFKEKFLGLHNLLPTDREWTKKSQAIDELRRAARRSFYVSVFSLWFVDPVVAYGIFATLVLLAHYVNDWEAQKNILDVEPPQWIQ